MKTIEVTNAIYASLEKLSVGGETVRDVINKMTRLDNISEIMAGVPNTQEEASTTYTSHIDKLLSGTGVHVWRASKSTAVITRADGTDRLELLLAEDMCTLDTYGFGGTVAKFTTEARVFMNKSRSSIELHLNGDVSIYDVSESGNTPMWLLDIISVKIAAALGWSC